VTERKLGFLYPEQLAGWANLLPHFLFDLLLWWV
jgi:hypothetical protein